jgi:hypothetical protein
MTNRPPVRVVAAALAAVAMPALMLAVSAGFLPQPTLTTPAWWVLPTVAVGYWVAWMAWADGRAVPGR